MAIPGASGGAGGTWSLNTDQAQATQTLANDATRRPSSSGLRTPLSSTPTTPGAMPSPRRPSHPATSPVAPHSPNPAKGVRRASSAMSLTQRPQSASAAAAAASSPGLKKKSSRSSLGGRHDEEERRPTPKRSISNLISGLREAQTKMESIEEPPPLTAPEIAAAHFTRELVAHAHAEAQAQTLVVLHDACYGHRYSRLKTTKSTLSMIVERPERLHASVLGAATAYVRLGGHHAGATNAPRPTSAAAATPPFKIRRSARAMDVTSPCVTAVHGTAWMGELRQMCSLAGDKIAAGAKELSRSSTPTNPEKRKLHEGDLYLCAESLNAFQGALGGVADAVDAVFSAGSETQRAFVAVRPPGHHCSADHPSGFCWLNNVHVGIEYAAQTHGLTHAAILDFDLHHGDGSQAITWTRNSKNNVKRLSAKPNSKLKLGPDIGYYSLHDINSYPCEMGDGEKVQAASLCIDGAHGQSIWNVHLDSWKTEAEFWQLYATKYSVLLEKARAFLHTHATRGRAEGKTPKAAIFISAGFDASEWEGAGMQRHKVNVPTEFYARFTRDIVELAREPDLACEGRVISVLEGGYSDRALCSGVLSHLSGLCATPIEAAIKEESASNGAPVELDQMMRGLGISNAPSREKLEYDESWWSEAHLTALELKVMPPPLAVAKKMRLGAQKTYATPTESFAYKVVDTDKFARSISGTMRNIERPARPPTPPPPEVDWVIATQELHRLLVPSDRQTRSCTPDDLAPVKPAKKARESMLPATTTEEAGKPRQLRDRKMKGPVYPETAHSDDLESIRSASRSSRRQTIADLPTSDPVESQHQRRASRRLSAGSTLSSIGGDLDPNPPPLPRVPSESSRPSTATSTNGKMKPPPAPAPAMQVKKTRLPAPPKAKRESTSSAPVSPLRSNKPVVSAPTVAVQPLVAQLNGHPESAPAAGNEVDALTSGMKRITLKVGTKEDHDKKQKERVDAERKARALKAAETRRVNAAAKKAAAAAPKPIQQTSAAAAPLAAAPAAPAAPHAAPLAKENTVPPPGASALPPELVSRLAPQPEQSNGVPQPQALSEAATMFTTSARPSADQAYPQQQPALQPPAMYLPATQIATTQEQAPPVAPGNKAGQEQLLANGQPPLPRGSASLPVRPDSSKSSDNVWRPGTPVKFGSHHHDSAPQAEDMKSLGEQLMDKAESPTVTYGDAVGMGGAKADPSLVVKKQESSIWDVPVTPR